MILDVKIDILLTVTFYSFQFMVAFKTRSAISPLSAFSPPGQLEQRTVYFAAVNSLSWSVVSLETIISVYTVLIFTNFKDL